MMKRDILLVPTLIFLLFLSYGCIPLVIGAAAGAGGVAYAKGRIEKNFDVPVLKLHDISLKALKDLGVFIKSDELNVHSSSINFEFEDGKKGNIKITALTELSSKLMIRIGIVGDEVKSRMILNTIERKL